MKFKNKKINKNGLTLIEVVIALGLSAMVIVVISTFQDQFNRASLFINQELENRQGLEQVFQSLVTEIRSAGPSSIGSYPIESATSTSFTFYSDVDADNIFERVRYYFGTSTLEKGVVKPTGNPLTYVTSTETIRTMVKNVLASSTFEYFGDSYTGSESPLSYPINISSIRVVKATVYADLNPSLSPQPSIFTNTINIRNLRSN